MTAQTVLFEAGSNLLIRRIGFEKCPSPSITPQRVIGEPILGVLDHHEPRYGLIRSPTWVACRHLGVIGRERFFVRRKSSRRSSLRRGTVSKFIPSFRYFVESPFCESPGRVRT